MSTFDRQPGRRTWAGSWKAAGALGVCGGALFILANACQSAGECLRFTDCAEGLTCAAGHCVVPPVSVDLSDGAASGDGTTPVTDGDGSASLDGSVTTDAAPSTDAATESGASDSSDAQSSDAEAVDAQAVDAASDV